MRAFRLWKRAVLQREVSGKPFGVSLLVAPDLTVLRHFARIVLTVMDDVVRLIYCESGIETRKLVFFEGLNTVRLIYCESGIETNML